MILWRNIEIFKFFTFYHFDPDPRFPPFLLYVRWKSGVSFVRRCFRDGKVTSLMLHIKCEEVFQMRLNILFYRKYCISVITESNGIT